MSDSVSICVDDRGLLYGTRSKAHECTCLKVEA